TSGPGVAQPTGDAVARRSLEQRRGRRGGGSSWGEVRRDLGAERAGREDRRGLYLCDGAVREGDDGAPRGVLAESAGGAGNGCERSGGAIVDAASGGARAGAVRVEPDGEGVSEGSVHPRVV